MRIKGEKNGEKKIWVAKVNFGFARHVKNSDLLSLSLYYASYTYVRT